jgi:hypothetical protein
MCCVVDGSCRCKAALGEKDEQIRLLLKQLEQLQAPKKEELNKMYLPTDDE